MSLLRHGAVGLALTTSLTTALVAGLAPASQADNLGLTDGLVSITSLGLGNVCAGATKSQQVGFALERRGEVNNNVWADGAEVSITGATAGSGFTLGSVKKTTPADWTNGDERFISAGSAGLTLSVPAGAPLGDAEAVVKWSATGKGAKVASVARNSDLKVTWKVVSCAPTDTTRPNVAYTLTPAIPVGTDGWHNQPVAIDWTVSDTESAIMSSTGCQDETFSNDGVYEPTCAATSGGGTAGPVRAAVKIDRTAPEVTPHVDGTIGADGWYTGDVEVTWTISDATGGSGIDSTSGDCDGTTLSTDNAHAHYTCTVVDKAGNTTSVSQPVKRDATAPVITESVSGTLGNDDWYTSDVQISWTATDATSGVPVEPCPAVSVEDDTPGTTYTCVATDEAGNSASSRVDVKRDTAGPSVSYSLSGPEGLANWYRGPVTVTWRATDGGSGLAQGCAPETVSADGVHSPECVATDVAGNATASNALVQLDATAPVITPVVAGGKTIPGSEWYTSNVDVSWTVIDNPSGVASGVASKAGCDGVVVSADTSGTTYTCSALDVAGNPASESVTVKRDATAPVLTLTGGPVDGATYDFGDAPAPSTCVATDATSDVDGGCTVSGAGSAVGTHTQVATASDKAGNVAKESRTYTVAPWRLDGFYRPVNMGSTVVNTVKAGSTVPLKFNVYKGTAPLTASTGATFTARKISCTTGDLQDPLEEFLTAGATSLRYDAVGGQWVQNWATPGSAKGSCYRVTMTTADGSSIAADFMLK